MPRVIIMYERPYTVEEIKQHYPNKAAELLRDPVHFWRATTGIELIHREPTLEEQERIWANWQQMTDPMKEQSDTKSFELFGKSNADHHREIISAFVKNQ